MTKKYTPGPWRVVKAGGIVQSGAGYSSEAEDDCIVDKDGKEVLGVSEWIRVEDDDLFLMSLAPELLGALEELVNHLKDGCYCGEVFPDGHPMLTAIDVIFKAKGEYKCVADVVPVIQSCLYMI